MDEDRRDIFYSLKDLERSHVGQVLLDVVYSRTNSM